MNDTTTSVQPLRIAVLADLHYGADHLGSRRCCSIAELLLERAVRRLNRLIRPDLVLVAGDLIDDGDAPDAEDRLRKLRSILEALDCPYRAVPGNHDGDPERFFRVFPRTAASEDIGGLRLVAFADQDEPGFNATRRAADLERIRAAGADCPRPLVALQHVCLFPPERSAAPYNYTNVAAVVEHLKAAGVTLSISGHYHRGAADCTQDGVTYVNAPGLCEAPFPFLEITLDGGRVSTRRHTLALPEAPRFVDNHLHTELAYCAENMTVERTIALARLFGLPGVTFTEHAGQLYFERKPYWGNDWLRGGLAAADAAHDRMPAYLALKRAHEGEFARFSLETECDIEGRLLIKPSDRAQFGNLMGTIHALPGLTRAAPPTRRDGEDFLRLVETMARQGIGVLAHPFRVFHRAGWEIPGELFEPAAGLLREHGVAAELNFHANYRPPVEFVRCCLDRGVRFSFGSDSHNLSEVGDFALHMALLREAGYDGDFSDIVIERI